MDLIGLTWFAALGASIGLARVLLYTALQLGKVPVVVPFVACYPLANILALLGIILTVSGLIFLLRT